MSSHFKGCLEGVETWTNLSQERMSCSCSAGPVAVSAPQPAWSPLWLLHMQQHQGQACMSLLHCSVLPESNIGPFGGFVCVHCYASNPKMAQATSWVVTEVIEKEEQNQMHFLLAFLFFLLNNAHIISCLKLQSLAAKHISSVCVAWEVSMSPASCCHLHPPLHRKLPPIKWACRNVSLVAYAGVCVMYFCSAAVCLGKILFSPRCYFQELTSRFL